ncbi:MAG: hypothetical protein Q9191_002386 [Dirinaria sp. TL-2023a]
MSAPQALTLAVPNNAECASPVSSAITSPSEPRTRSPSPSSQTSQQVSGRPYRAISRKDTQQSTHPQSAADPTSPTLTSLPPFPSSPKSAPKHIRDQSKSFFANLKASKSSNKIQNFEPTIRQVSEDTTRGHKELRENSFYSLRKSPGSTPDLSKSTFDNSSADVADDTQSQSDVPQRPTGTSILSDTALVTSQSEYNNLKKGRPRFAQLLNRTRSMRIDENGLRAKPPAPIRTTDCGDRRELKGNNDPALKSAPLQQEKDRSIREMVGSGMRNRSADRQAAPKQYQPSTTSSRLDREPVQASNASHFGSFREHAGGHLFTNIKNTSNQATDGLRKAGKGFFGKITRSGSSNSREPADEEPYVCTTINLPLVEQTRRTRIAKRLEDSKDKTEFWMPALPWRCIDYLNFRGCEEEGLYRVPGSGQKVKEWQRRFDTEHDINLFDEPELYDINIIGSMFKAWLRDLPTEILPKDTQARIARECVGAQEVPQMLKNELSMLPPWNYYLLFAITCHLSLLHAYVDQNKMNYNNLVICFQPALKIDSFCFNFLVCHWRDCWQGCWTEKETLDEEYRILERLNSSGGDSSGGSTAVEERPAGSSQSNKSKFFARGQDRSKPPPLSLTKPSDEHLSTPNTNVPSHSRNNSQLPELAPVMPLSPIGL